MKSTKTGLATAALATLALGACDDSAFLLSQDGGGNVSSIEGAYGGFLSGAHIEYYRLLLTGTDLWLAYGVNSSLAGFQATGFFHASGMISGQAYASTSAIEYFVQSPAGTGTASASYHDAVQPPLLTGSLVIGASTSNFSAGPIAGANFNFRSPALLSALNGTWMVTDLGGNPHQLVVDALGSFTVDAGAACEASGAFTGSANRNAYTGVISFGSGCPSNEQGKTLTGVALVYANQAPAGTQLIAMFRDTTGNSVGYALNGVR